MWEEYKSYDIKNGFYGKKIFSIDCCVELPFLYDTQNIIINIHGNKTNL